MGCRHGRQGFGEGATPVTSGLFPRALKRPCGWPVAVRCVLQRTSHPRRRRARPPAARAGGTPRSPGNGGTPLWLLPRAAGARGLVHARDERTSWSAVRGKRPAPATATVHERPQEVGCNPPCGTPSDWLLASTELRPSTAKCFTSIGAGFDGTQVRSGRTPQRGGDTSSLAFRCAMTPGCGAPSSREACRGIVVAHYLEVADSLPITGSPDQWRGGVLDCPGLPWIVLGAWAVVFVAMIAPRGCADRPYVARRMIARHRLTSSAPRLVGFGVRTAGTGSPRIRAPG